MFRTPETRARDETVVLGLRIKLKSEKRGPRDSSPGTRKYPFGKHLTPVAM